MASTEPEHEHREEEGAPTNEDEDTGAQVAPIVKLEGIAVTAGEEGETSFCDIKAKLFLLDKDGNPLKEKDAHPVKFLKHKEHQGQEGEINKIRNLVFDKSKNKAMVSVPTMDPSSRVCSTLDSSCNFELSSSPPSTCHELLLGAQLRHKIFLEKIVVEAFGLAEIAHKWMKRVSGHPYLQHCVETAVLVALNGADSTVVAAGLLHDTLDDSFMTYDYVFKTFGAEVAHFVKEVSWLSHLSKLARDSNTASKKVEADYLHTMFLAKADARALLIKLADRLHNMRTLDALPKAKRDSIANETLKIFAPLANRLGISVWKDELENLCFKHLYPTEHEELSKLVGSFDEKMINSAIETLKTALCANGISYLHLYGRQKRLYSIYSKMEKKELNRDNIYDILGLRLIVYNVEDCYRALSVVHDLWPELHGKDYIKYCKVNGYQSLHTVVRYEKLVPLEVQIRTEGMHVDAEFSFAAHWIYKEGFHKHSAFVLKCIEQARSFITRQCETMNSSYLDSTRPPCTFPSHSGGYLCSDSGQDWPVFVIIIDKDKMSVHEFSANSKITDLLEKSRRGGSRSEEELKPRLNFLPVNDPTCKLKMGDVLELNMLLVGILMSVQEFSAKRFKRTITDFLEKSRRGGSRSEEELKPRLNSQTVDNPKRKLKMGDVLELTSAQPQRSKSTWLTLTIRDKSLTTVCKERKYDRELAESSTALLSG